MSGMAGTVYAVRAYTRTLALAEVDQNHFADLMTFYEIDVRDFVADIKDGDVSTAELSAIYAAMGDRVTVDGDNEVKTREYYLVVSESE